MFNGLSKDKADAYLKPYAPALLDFVEAIYSDTKGQDDGGRRRPAGSRLLSRALAGIVMHVPPKIGEMC
jgi:hypothetical protein